MHGHGTIVASLAHAVPLVCLPHPIIADQVPLPEQVERIGAGRGLDGEWASEVDIAAAVDARRHARYILYVPNVRNNQNTDVLDEAERRFIDDLARLLVPWGVPHTAARVYGYLLLSPSPVSLDHLSENLQVSKSSASVAARLLEMYTLVRRHGVRGSRRVLYEASDNYEGMLAAQNRMLASGAELLKAGARSARSGATRARLGEMAEFYEASLEAMESLLRHWRARRR
jgi:predicted transcriptional regulator